MLIADLFVALVFGVFIVWMVSFLFGTKGPWGSFLWFFLVVALFAWAGGIWFVPFGPILWGIGWLPIFLMAIFVSLLLTAASPRNRRRRVAAQENDAPATQSEVVVDAILWVLIIGLFLFGIVHYAWYPRGG